ncbi:MAG: YdeI/OmpD-associated family protein [Thermoleophilia bacterium]
MPKKNNDDKPEPIMFANREEWRAWLEENHDKSDGIWLAYYKKHTGKSSVQYEEAVEEALCFGWIDSQVNAIDDERYMQHYTPRRRSSIWSQSNKERVHRLLVEGRMTEYGMAAVLEAQKGGNWETLTDVDNLVVPDDLSEALSANEKAEAFFNRINASDQKAYLFWITSAKQEETRKKRIKMTVKQLAKNKRRTG